MTRRLLDWCVVIVATVLLAAAMTAGLSFFGYGLLRLIAP